MLQLTCIGELLVDMIGEEEKSLKENSEFSKRPGGAPANVAVAASRMNADVEIVATIGKDEFGGFLKQKMEQENIKTDALRQIEQKTTLAFASLDEEAKPHFMFYRSADEQITEKQLKKGCKNADIIHVGSLPFTDQETGQNILKHVKNTSAEVSFDPNLRDDLMTEKYGKLLKKMVKHMDILTAAEEEIEYFGGLNQLKKQIPEIIITKGENGAELHHNGEKTVAKPREVEVVDTTGAGDALTGTYLAYRNQGKKKALEKAVEAASISTTSKGAMSALPQKQELR